MPCAAASNSMPRMCAVLAIIGCRRRAAKVAIETWSSWLALVGSESTLAGWASDLFSLASAAAVTCAIMKPLFRPASAVRNGGRRDTPASISIAMRRSAMAPTSAIASAMRVGRQRHRLGVEVAAGDHRAVFGEHQRVVGHRVGLAHQHQRGVAQLVQAGAHDLRLAAQAVRVLHAVVALEVGAADRAAFEQRAVVLRHVDLPGLAAQRVDARVERAVAAARGVDRQRADHQRRFEHRLETSAARAAPARSRSACR